MKPIISLIHICKVIVFALFSGVITTPVYAQTLVDNANSLNTYAFANTPVKLDKVIVDNLQYRKYVVAFTTQEREEVKHCILILQPTQSLTVKYFFKHPFNSINHQQIRNSL